MDGSHRFVAIGPVRPRYGRTIRLAKMALAILILWALISTALWTMNSHGFGRGWPVFGAATAVSLVMFGAEWLRFLTWPIANTVLGTIGCYGGIVVAGWLVAFL